MYIFELKMLQIITVVGLAVLLAVAEARYYQNNNDYVAYGEYLLHPILINELLVCT